CLHPRSRRRGGTKRCGPISSAADAVSNGGPLISSPDSRTAWHTLRILRWLLWAARYRSVQGNFGACRPADENHLYARRFIVVGRGPRVSFSFALAGHT